ncbi:MAG: hypothetical protein ACLTDV_04455 [Eubacterium sp.]
MAKERGVIASTQGSDGNFGRRCDLCEKQRKITNPFVPEQKPMDYLGHGR